MSWQSHFAGPYQWAALTSATCSLPSLFESHMRKACAAARFANQRKRPMAGTYGRAALRSSAVAKQGVHLGMALPAKPGRNCVLSGYHDQIKVLLQAYWSGISLATGQLSDLLDRMCEENSIRNHFLALDADEDRGVSAASVPTRCKTTVRTLTRSLSSACLSAE